jgi:hypothetical protein
MKVKCPGCGKERDYKPSVAAKISGYCKRCARIGERSSQWEGGLRVIHCSVCKKPKKVRKNRAKLYIQRPVPYKCSGCALKTRPTGDKSPTWKGGRKIYRYPREWTALRSRIRQRDGGKCVACGGVSKRMPVHHIDYDKENLDESNLVTLCNPCHGKTNFNRLKWILFFKTLNR